MENKYIDIIQLENDDYPVRDSKAQQEINVINANVEQLTSGYGKTSQDLNELTQRVQTLENKSTDDRVINIGNVNIPFVESNNATQFFNTSVLLDIKNCLRDKKIFSVDGKMRVNVNEDGSDYFEVYIHNNVNIIDVGYGTEKNISCGLVIPYTYTSKMYSFFILYFSYNSENDLVSVYLDITNKN